MEWIKFNYIDDIIIMDLGIEFLWELCLYDFVISLIIGLPRKKDLTPLVLLSIDKTNLKF